MVVMRKGDRSREMILPIWCPACEISGSHVLAVLYRKVIQLGCYEMYEADKTPLDPRLCATRTWKQLHSFCSSASSYLNRSSQEL